MDKEGEFFKPFKPLGAGFRPDVQLGGVYLPCNSRY